MGLRCSKQKLPAPWPFGVFQEIQKTGTEMGYGIGQHAIWGS